MGVGTGTAGGVGRDTGYPVVHTMACSLAYTETSAKVVGYLPAGAVVLRVNIVVGTAFNGSGADTVTLGSTTTANELVSSGIDISSTGVKTGTVLGTFAIPTADTTIYAKYTDANSNASAGAATVVVEFAPRVV